MNPRHIIIDGKPYHQWSELVKLRREQLAAQKTPAHHSPALVELKEDCATGDRAKSRRPLFAACIVLIRHMYSRSTETVWVKPCRSSVSRYSGTDFGGFFMLSRCVCAAAATTPGARPRRWRMNSSGC